MIGWLESLLRVGRKAFVAPETREYPEVKPDLPPPSPPSWVLWVSYFSHHSECQEGR